jgi:hypothetical protein
MSKVTQLASGQIHMSDDLRVELITPNSWPNQHSDPDAVTEEPPRIRIIWPIHSTVCTPAKFDQAVANAMKVLSNAVVELGAIRVWRKL